MPAELAELLREAEQHRREAHIPRPAVQARPWFRMETKKAKPRIADVWIYDTIGPSWFDDSTDAKSFARMLAGLDVDEIDLHVNSPGGDFFDGLAIYNSLKNHPASITAIVDGLAASAASFVIQAGDVRRVNQAAQLMVHDASGLVIGNADDMAKMLDLLDQVSDSIAGIYAARGGGEPDDWRRAMKSETWYTATEAVEAGLADEAVDAEPTEPPVRNTWDLAIFNYAGRQAAPPPAMPSASARTDAPQPAGQGDQETEGAVADYAKLREKLGLSADLSDDDLAAALTSAGVANQQPPPADPPQAPAPTNPPEPGKGDDDDLPPAQATASGRVKVVDAAVWEKMVNQAGKVDELIAERQREKRDSVIADAMRAGKFGPAEKEGYEKLWDAAPKEAERLIAQLTPGRIPVTASGYGVDLDPDEAAENAMFDGLYPPEMRYGNQGVGSRG